MGSAFSYPTGPDECENVEGKCPRVDSPTDGAIVFLYCVWAATIVLFTVYYLLRRAKQNNGEGSVVRRPSVYRNSSVSMPRSRKSNDLYAHLLGGQQAGDDTEDADDSIHMAYRKSTFGTFCFYWMNMVSFGWLAIFLVILFDQYFDCQLQSIDNLCFYGSYPIFGKYDRNSEYFFAAWCMSIVWFVFLLIYQNQIRGWFMQSSHMADAEYMYVWTKDVLNTETYAAGCAFTDVEPMLVVKWIRDMRLRMTPAHLRNGHEALVKVMKNSDNVPYFVHEATRYVFNATTNQYVIPMVDIGLSYKEFHAAAEGMSSSRAEKKLAIYGPNQIPFEVSTVKDLFLREIFTYFYFYQAAMYAVWFWQSYLFVASVETCLVLMGAVVSVFIQWKNEKTISLLTQYETRCSVKRDGSFVDISSNDLVPGDILCIRDSHWVVPCDLVLLSGSAVMNESGLTGESMPVLKSMCASNSSELYDVNHSGVRHTVFAGTTVLQLNPDKTGMVLGLVTATSTSTCKGQLISTILYPEQLLFKYEEELEAVIAFLLLYGVVAFALSMYLQNSNGTSATFITMWAYGMFTCSQIFSPLLPVALKVGQIRSSKRLLEKGVFCVNPRRIAISGKVNVFCFDKTGTLTNDGMEFSGVSYVTKRHGLVVDSPPFLSDLCKVDSSSMNPMASPSSASSNIPFDMLSGLATCHSLSTFGSDGYVGNDVEVKMFSSTKWSLRNIPNSDHSEVKSPDGRTTLKVVRKFEFDHGKQTMSVVVENSGAKDRGMTHHMFCKGSFEKIAGMCSSTSVPEEYFMTAQNFALNGGYVLALGYRPCDNEMVKRIDMLTRDEVEVPGSFTLLGLLVFRNEPKADSRDAILSLRDGVVRPVMITGDNAQCGQYIAKTCGLVNESAPVYLGEIDKETNDVVWSEMKILTADSAEKREYFTTSQMIDEMQRASELEQTGNGAAGNSPEFAISGNATIDALDREGVLNGMLPHVRIFARMSPASKSMIITRLRSLGFVVGMCGDGGNDCGALRAAHAGIALSEAEASVVSPFTSKTKSVQSVVDLLKEGRASLATSFANYKFLIAYGMIFSIVKMVGFYYGVIMSSMSYYCIDGLAITTLSYTMTLSSPVDRLSKKRPTASLLGPVTMASALGVNVIAVLCMIFALVMMRNDPDYVQWPAEYAETSDWWTLADNWETTVMYNVFFLFLITSAAIYSSGYEFRQPLFHNLSLVINVAGPFLLTVVVLLMDANALTNYWHTASYQFNKEGTESPVWAEYQKDGNDTSPAMSISFRLKLLFLILGFIALAIIWQSLVMEGFVGEYLKKNYSIKKKLLKLRY